MWVILQTTNLDTSKSSTWKTTPHYSPPPVGQLFQIKGDKRIEQIMSMYDSRFWIKRHRSIKNIFVTTGEIWIWTVNWIRSLPTFLEVRMVPWLYRKNTILRRGILKYLGVYFYHVCNFFSKFRGEKCVCAQRERILIFG